MNPQVFAIITGMLTAFFIGAASMWTYLEVKKFNELKKKNPLPNYPKANKS